jgi:DNA-binding SARP family transcriptional activator
MPIRKTRTYALYFLCIFSTLLYSLCLSGQTSPSFGLGFYNNEIVQDRRTTLDLTPGKALTFHGNTDIRFDLAFLPGHPNSFGYILRLVSNNTRNIDLLFDKVSMSLGRFRMVVGDKPPFATFSLDSNHLFHSWTPIRLTIDFSRDRILLCVNNKETFVQNGMHLSSSDSFRISFGACPVQQFKTTDVPPMKIRDVRISSDGEDLYHWPLDEEKGTQAPEAIQEASAVVSNPLWMRGTHYEWKLLDSLLIDGPASCAFDSRDGILYLVGRDSLSTYNLSSGSMRTRPYTSGRQALLAGNQSLYDPFTRRLYNIYLDEQIAASFDFNAWRWDERYKPGDINYWHVNKFCSSFDTSIYVLNGYGHMEYKNSVFRYHIPDHTWEKISPRGDSLIPRYLAAAGATGAGDFVYIVGGYGSSSGQQILNPRNLYDMLRFDIRTRTFKKLFELSPVPEDFAFANSLIIDQKNSSYYGLIFNNEKYHTDLQLIKGSLNGPAYQAVGDKIPYPFHDIESFSDLYYSPAGDRFIAVVFFTDSTSASPSRTYVHLYSLDGPPEPYMAETPAIGPAARGDLPGYIWYLLLPLLLIAGGGLYVFRRNRRKSMVSPAGERHAAAGSVAAVTDPLPLVSPLASGKMEPVEPAIVRASIFLFGDLQVFDTEGGDLTKQFSPLLKQLFLLIFLHSLKNNRGISSEKLNDILWFDKDEKSARNNRSVNIAKLKALLDKTGGCDLSKETGYWKIVVDPQAVRVDYMDYLSIIQNRETLNKKEVKALAAITQRGSLLNDVEYPWLDPFKSDVSNHVIDTYLHFARQGPADPEFMIELADYIFYFDSVNEEAMVIKCRALVQLGKHSLAKNAYTTFLKEYKHIYGEDFRKDFQTVLQA